MNVNSLQVFLRSLMPALDAVGGNATLRKGVESVAASLDPFAHIDFDQFAAFLKRAEEFDRTGVVPMAAPKGRTSTRKPTAPAVDLHNLASRLAELRTLGDEGPSRREAVEREWASLGLEALKPGDWLTLAAGLSLEVPTKVKTAKDRARFVQKQIYRGFLPSAGQLVAQVREIEEAAATPQTTPADIDARLDALNLANQEQELLLEACQTLDLTIKRKSVANAIQAIRAWLQQRKTAQQVSVV